MAFSRRTVLSGLAVGGAAPIVAARAAPADGDGARPRTCAAPSVERRGYCPGPLGQTHYRLQGEGPMLLLLHETPWSSHQYARVQPILAEAGYATLAADTPGYGMSPAPSRQPHLEDYAAQMLAVLDAMKVPRATVVGDHTGAALAILMAALWPERVRRIVLYGAPIYTDDERRTRLANFARYAPPLVLRPDGSHLSDRFVFVRQVMTGGVGSLEGVQDSTISYMLAEDKKQMVLRALFEHPSLSEALPRVKAKGLVITAPDDTLRTGAARAHALRPDFDYADLGLGGPQLVFDRPEAWSGAVLPFLRRTDA